MPRIWLEEKEFIDFSKTLEEVKQDLFQCKLDKKIPIAYNWGECGYIKQIPTHPSYFICETGDFIINSYNNIVKWNSRAKEGYKRFNIYDVEQSKMVQRFAHVLVAQAYIPMIEGKPEVDHINRVRKDNHYKNLRWVDRQENLANRVFKNKKGECQNG